MIRRFALTTLVFLLATCSLSEDQEVFKTRVSELPVPLPPK